MGGLLPEVKDKSAAAIVANNLSQLEWNEGRVNDKWVSICKEKQVLTGYLIKMVNGFVMLPPLIVV